MARLSVNLNKVALLRNSRHTGVPDVLKFARIAHDAGAQGITVHPRPDERHIRRSDVPAITQPRPSTVTPERMMRSEPHTWPGSRVMLAETFTGPRGAN